MKIQEASEDIAKGGILFPSPKISYMEANTEKDEETGDYRHEISLKHPKCAKAPQLCCHT